MWRSDEPVEIEVADDADEISVTLEPVAPALTGFVAVKGVHRRGGPHYSPGDHVPEDAFSSAGIKQLLSRSRIKRVGE